MQVKQRHKCFVFCVCVCMCVLICRSGLSMLCWHRMFESSWWMTTIHGRILRTVHHHFVIPLIDSAERSTQFSSLQGFQLPLWTHTVMFFKYAKSFSINYLLVKAVARPNSVCSLWLWSYHISWCMSTLGDITQGLLHMGICHWVKHADSHCHRLFGVLKWPPSVMLNGMEN